MRATPRPISIADVAEVCLEDRLENARHRLLKQAVADRGNTQRPRTGLARPLGYLYPPNRWSTVGSGFKPFADLLYPQFQLTLKLLDASPSTPPAPCRLIVPQVSLRNSGVSRCASEVNRTLRSNCAFFAIWASCVDTFIRLRVYGPCCPGPVSLCPAPSPCTRLSRAPSSMGRSDFRRRVGFPQNGSFG